MGRLPASYCRVSSDKYQAALDECNHNLAERGLKWQDLSEAALDTTTAKRIIDLFEFNDGQGISKASTLVAALSQVLPRYRLSCCWKCLDVWRVRVPPEQAKAFAPETAQGLSVWMVQSGQFIVATVCFLCFCGLFRASELLICWIISLCLLIPSS